VFETIGAKFRTSVTPLRRIGEPDEIAGAAIFPRLAGRSFVTDRPSSSTVA